MKRFLINTTIVFALLLGTMCLLDVWITHNLHHSTANVFQGMNDVYYDSTYYDLVIMGSSRGLFQYDTRVLDSVLGVRSYNAGINGRGIVSQIIKFHAFVKRHKAPSLIIQNIDCFLLAEDNGFEREQYLPYFFDKDLFEAIKEREDFNGVERFVPLIRYAGYEQVIKEGLKVRNKLPKSKTYQGYSPSFSKWNGDQLSKINEVGFSIDSVPFAEFRKYLEECRACGIRVVFVYAPFFSGAQEKMSENTLKEMRSTFGVLGEEYDIPVLSWWDSPICCDTNYFYNSTHLNAIGARKFTQELARCIDSLSYLR